LRFTQPGQPELDFDAVEIGDKRDLACSPCGGIEAFGLGRIDENFAFFTVDRNNRREKKQFAVVNVRRNQTAALDQQVEIKGNFTGIAQKVLGVVIRMIDFKIRRGQFFDV
jgi:hypothetical protein